MSWDPGPPDERVRHPAGTPLLISHAMAEMFRGVLGDIQGKILADPHVPKSSRENLVRYVSERGFKLVDALEGTVR